MISITKPKAGLIPVAQPYYLAEWCKIAPIEPLIERATKALEKAGIEVVSFGTKYFLTERDSTDAAEELMKKGVDALIFLVTTWILTDQVLDPIQRTRLPFVLWAIPETIRSSIVGGSVVKGALDNMGITNYKWVVGLPEDEETIKSIRAFIRAACTHKLLRHSKMGVIGYTTMQMYTADVDFAEVKKIFGISITHFDSDELIREIEKIPDKEAEKVYERITKEFKRVEPSKKFMLKAIKEYLAIKKMAKENGLQLIGAKCHPSPLVEYGMLPCLANTLINDEGEIVFVCENDLNAALTMLIEHYLTGQPTILADLGKIDRKKNTIKLFNCGSAASWFAGGPQNVSLVHQFEWVGKGVASDFIFKPGRVTIARLGKVNGCYVMHIATGEVIPTEKEVPRWPEGEIRLDGSVDEFVKNVLANHYHIVYEDIKEELVDLCRLLGIKSIVT